MNCSHRRTEMGKVIIRGGGFHILQRCADCHVNIRGPGVWVGRIEVADPDALPVFRDCRDAVERGEQKTLF